MSAATARLSRRIAPRVENAYDACASAFRMLYKSINHEKRRPGHDSFVPVMFVYEARAVRRQSDGPFCAPYRTYDCFLALGARSTTKNSVKVKQSHDGPLDLDHFLIPYFAKTASTSSWVAISCGSASRRSSSSICSGERSDSVSWKRCSMMASMSSRSLPFRERNKSSMRRKRISTSSTPASTGNASPAQTNQRPGRGVVRVDDVEPVRLRLATSATRSATSDSNQPSTSSRVRSSNVRTASLIRARRASIVSMASTLPDALPPSKIPALSSPATGDL